MKLENSIGWCDDTGNIVIGCEKVSEGCKNCYAEVGTAARIRRASGLETWGPAGERVPVAGFTTKLRRLNSQCICDNCHELLPFAFLGKTHSCDRGSSKGVCRRIRFFGDSNSDWLDKRWPVKTLVEFLHTIYCCPNIDFLLLTKRIGDFWERINEAFEDPSSIRFSRWLESWERQLPTNIWLGVSVENQKRADERIPALVKIPAVVRFLSVEPLLSDVNLRLYGTPMQLSNELPKVAGIHWIIVGAESGKNRRDCGVQALVSVANQAVIAGIPVYVKQDCAFKSGQQGRIPDEIWQLKQFPN